MENINNSYPCPSCGEAVDFRNATNNVALCSHKHVWQRTGEKLLPVEIPIIHHAADVIQPGTTGIWNDLPFTVTGRFRLWFKDSAFNYWTIDMGDKQIRYLAEGYGMFSIYEPQTYIRSLNRNNYDTFSAAQHFILPDNQLYEITGKNITGYIDIEGAVYKPDFAKKVKTIEAASKSGNIEIIQWNENEVQVFHLHPVSFQTLNLQNLQQTTSQGKEFACRNCSAKTVVKTYPYAQSWVCDNCQTRLSLMDSQLVREHGSNKSTPPEMHLPIGSSVTLKDVSYHVIGFAHKQDKVSKHDKWKEYTLYNKELGYAFLTESDGHWMLLKETQEAPLPSFASFNYFSFENKTFNRFLTYQYLIIYATGEFPGNVFEDAGVTEAIDFISPPEILSIEKGPNKRKTWFRGEYINRNIIGQQANGSIPNTYGIAPAQPRSIADTSTIVGSAIIAIIIMLLVQYCNEMMHLRKKVLDTNYVLTDSVASKTFITERFELSKWKSNLEFKIYAPVDNSWFELNATLVNVNDGTEYNLEQGLEYYRGYEDGESWSEGSNNTEAYFTSIPAGTYFLQLTGTRDQGTGLNRPFVFSVKVVNDTPMYHNFWLIFLLIISWPAILGFSHYYNEKQRWSNSPYSTFNDN